MQIDTQNPAVRFVLRHHLKHGRGTMTDGLNPLRFVLGVIATVAVVLGACALAPAEFSAFATAVIFALCMVGIVVVTWWMAHSDDKTTAVALSEWATPKNQCRAD